MIDFVKVTKDIISIDTTAPPGLNYKEAIDYLEPLFKQLGCDTRKISIPPQYADGKNDRWSLLAHKRHPGKPRLILYGHIDVVPAEGWDAFVPREESGKIFGRGAADMKGAITAILLGIQEVKEKSLKYDLSIMITTDEEIGQAGQIRYLARYLEPLEGAYLFDLDSSFGGVSVAGLGVIHMDIKVSGKSVHSALSHMGENAIEKSYEVVAALLELKQKIIQRKSQLDAEPGVGLTKMESRLNINVIHGGIKVNIVPDECIISVDRRLIPEENVKDAKEELMSALAMIKGAQWEINKFLSMPTVPPLDDPIVDQLTQLTKAAGGHGLKFGEMGSGDLGYISALEWKAKHFGSGVIRPDCNIHGKDEFVYIKDIQSLGWVISRFIT